MSDTIERSIEKPGGIRPLKNRTAFRALGVIAFLLVLFLVLTAVSHVVTSTEDYKCYQWIRGFYREPKDSLDVVFLGSSVTYSEMNPMFIWDEEGISSWNFTTPGQQLELAEYMIREGIKRQPNAVYVVSLNTLDNEFPDAFLHYVTDYMPMSQNKVNMIDRYLELQAMDPENAPAEGTATSSKKWQFLFPVFFYHTRWDSLQSWDFNYRMDGFKSSSYYNLYLNGQEDITEDWKIYDAQKDLSDRTEDTLQRLLTLIEEKNVKVLFIVYPRAEPQTMAEQYNTLTSYLTGLGYDVLDLRDHVEDIGINLSSDFFNKKHGNIHGSIKLSEFVAHYLAEQYGFSDKRGSSDYSSWDKGLEEYLREISPYYVDLERDQSRFDASVPAPSLQELVLENGCATITWEPVDAAEGYYIYRKEADPNSVKDDVVGRYLELDYDLSGWERVGDVSDGAVTFTDETVELKKNHTYYYTVIPCRSAEGDICFGSYDYKGLSVTFKG